MSQTTHKRLVLTGWGYTVYACAAAIMCRALPGHPEIKGLSMRKLPAFLAELDEYEEIHILGIGLHADPDALIRALKRLKKSNRKPRIVWYSERDPHEMMKGRLDDLLEMHINHDGLLYAVCDVYPKLARYADFQHLELLAGLIPRAKTEPARPSPLLSMCLECPDELFQMAVSPHEELPRKSQSLEERYSTDSYHDLSDSFHKVNASFEEKHPDGLNSELIKKEKTLPASKRQKTADEPEEVVEFRILIAAAMYYYRNFQDTSVYSRVIKHISTGSWRRLNEEEKKLITWYKRFGSREIIGKSAVIEKLRADIVLVAAKDQLRVLICGESGTGKENIAEQIHIHSPRADECFLTFNCANVPENLMESRLFGYEKGAFTGADETTKGLFENANHGTLFLDEIGELSLESQGNLLRVLDSGRFMRVGGHEEIETDVRVICATNRNLGEMVRDGKFRMDLFYRLNVARLESPSLRDHMEDFEEIANHHWKQLNHKLLTQEQLAVLMDYKYPGNVRELFNLLDRADAFDYSDFSPMMKAHMDVVYPFAETVLPHQPENVPEPGCENLEEITLKHVIRIYREVDSQPMLAATRLGVSYNTLRSYLKKAEKMFGKDFRNLKSM